MSKYKYKNIAESIITKIQSGCLSAGVPVPSTREISDEYKVSPLTAIHALTHLAQKGYIVRNKGRNYSVSSKKNTGEEAVHFLTLLFRYISYKGPEFYGNKIMSGISREAAMASVSTYFSAMAQQYYLSIKKDLRKILKEAIALPQQNIGFIADYFIPDKLLAEIIQMTRLPVVLVGRVSTLPNVHSVVPDATPAYRAMLSTMKRLGYDAFICCEKTEPEREEVHQQAEFYKELSQTEKHVCILANFFDTPVAQQQALLSNAIKDMKGHRIAILSSSDLEARDILEYLGKMNIQVPKEIGVVGFYGTRIATDFSPQLTSISIPPELLGQLAAQLLISKDQQYKTHKIPMEFSFGETI